MLKILHVAETLKGGPGTIVRQLMAAQVSSDHQVHIVLPHSHLAELHDLRGPKIHSFERHKRGPMTLLRFGLRFIATVLEVQPDIIHLHSTFAGAICRPLVTLMRLTARSRIIYSPHCWAFIAVGGVRAKRIVGLIEAILSRSTDLVICGSEFERRAAEQYPIRCEMVVIPCAVEVPLRLPTPPALAADGRRELVFVGRFDHQKGLDILLEVAQRLGHGEYHFRVVGGFVRDSGELRRPPNVDFLPWQDREGLAEIYSSSTAVVMPSRWESFGLVALEAMSYGRPVIASDCCSLPELIQHGVNGWLFRTGDTDELSQILQRLKLEDYRAISHRCYETYLSHSSARMTEHYERAYVAARNGAPASGLSASVVASAQEPSEPVHWGSKQARKSQKMA